MDIFYDLDDLQALDDYQQFRQNPRVRQDFFVELSEKDFVGHFRFSKENVERLTDLVRDELGQQRHNSLSPEFQV